MSIEKRTVLLAPAAFGIPVMVAVWLTKSSSLEIAGNGSSGKNEID
jgi:hypothetical protein